MERIRLIFERIDVAAMTAAMTAAMARAEAGAIATFVGVVRMESDGARNLERLDYHAYEEMAVEQMNVIRRRAGEQFDILDAAVTHRLGPVAIGEASIAVVVCAAHRAASFEACRWIVDAIKNDVPIWKQDIWSDGTREWVTPT